MNFKRIKSNQWSCFKGILKCKYILEWAVVFILTYARSATAFKATSFVRFYSFEIHNLWHCYKVILNLKLSCYNLFWLTLDPPLFQTKSKYMSEDVPIYCL